MALLRKEQLFRGHSFGKAVIDVRSRSVSNKSMWSERHITINIVKPWSMSKSKSISQQTPKLNKSHQKEE